MGVAMLLFDDVAVYAPVLCVNASDVETESRCVNADCPRCAGIFWMGAKAVTLRDHKRRRKAIDEARIVNVDPSSL
jgi:hypothetical protein